MDDKFGVYEKEYVFFTGYTLSWIRWRVSTTITIDPHNAFAAISLGFFTRVFP
jgi:hypothetical protein